MLLVRFRPMISAFDRTKTVHSLYRVATVIGSDHINVHKLYSNSFPIFKRNASQEKNNIFQTGGYVKNRQTVRKVSAQRHFFKFVH
jgi:hypothetical protein